MPSAKLTVVTFNLITSLKYIISSVFLLVSWSFKNGRLLKTKSKVSDSGLSWTNVGESSGQQLNISGATPLLDSLVLE